jgi:hypothetical protein
MGSLIEERSKLGKAGLGGANGSERLRIEKTLHSLW